MRFQLILLLYDVLLSTIIGDILCHRRFSLFGHVARLDPVAPAHNALRLMVDPYEGRKPMLLFGAIVCCSSVLYPDLTMCQWVMSHRSNGSTDPEIPRITSITILLCPRP